MEQNQETMDPFKGAEEAMISFAFWLAMFSVTAAAAIVISGIVTMRQT